MEREVLSTPDSEPENTPAVPRTGRRNTIRPWQAVAIVAVLVLGGAGSYYGYSWLSDRGGSELAEGQQLIPVTRGNLTNQVSTNGSVVFPERESLAFGAPGTVGEVLVAEGEYVEAGQALASLDQTTIASLERAAAQAEVAVEDAADQLAEAKETADALSLAQAESAIVQAELTLRDAEELLAELRDPERTTEIAQATSAVAATETVHEQAVDALNALIDPDEDSRLAAAAAVTDARIALEAARETLADLEALPDPDAVAAARSALATAQETYENATADLELAQSDWATAVTNAEQTVSDAEQAYSDAFAGWFGARPSAKEASMAPADVLAAWGADLDVIYPQNDAARFDQIPQDDPSTPWDENLAFFWTRMSPAVVVGTCDVSGAPGGTRCVMDELESAWDSMDAGRDALATSESQSASALTAARAAQSNAADGLSDAQDALEDAETPANALALEDAGQAVEAAEANLQTAEDTAAELDEPDALAVASASADVDVATASLADTQEDLASLLEEPDKKEVDSAASDVEVAKAQLADAEATLEELRAVGTDDLLIALRETELTEALAMLDEAREALAGATIVAPWAGRVDTVAVEEGQSAYTMSVAIEIVDQTIADVAAFVDEIDVLSIVVGAEADIEMDALPGQVLTGTVVEIGKAAGSQQSVVTYPVSVRIEAPDGLQFVEGLSATASVVIQEEKNALLIPNQAVGGSYVQPTVRLSQDGEVSEVPVVLGASDGFWVVVRSGLSEGDRVVMESSGTGASADVKLQFQAQRGGSSGFGTGGAQGSQQYKSIPSK